MTKNQVARMMIDYLNGVGLHKAARLIKERVVNSPLSHLGDLGEQFDSKGEADYARDVREQAHRYCEARSKNIRPMRAINEADRNAVEGRDSALAFLAKRKRSIVRK